MKTNTIYIKNMVCPRCIMAVERVLDEAQVNYTGVALGQAELTEPLNASAKAEIEDKLRKLGFALLEPGKSVLIEKIKVLIIDQIYRPEKSMNMNFSRYLSDQLHYEYSYLSKLFSSVEGITIERFVASQRIERVKELLFYNELRLSEIADLMDYSSVAYLSAQFKKETGMTPSEFKKTHKVGHRDSSAH